ncbi:MAG: 23S rRNA (pseudouridine(1915)-N(3))-methyltransferase RlmH [Pseudomonadota bacterium]
MHISVICVGKSKSGPEKTLVDDYVTRFERAGPGIGLRSLKIVEVADGGGLDTEAERLLAKIPRGGRVLRLDEYGPQWTSTAFADKLGSWRDAGTPQLSFLIGGAAGYGSSVREAYPQSLAFGPQTWPHRLVRAMLCEQLYRAVSLLAGLPYHKA